MDKTPKAVVEAYEEIAKHTLAACDRSCRDVRPFRCCERQYCDMALAFAKMKGVDLRTTEHPTLPLMGPDNRCTAPPHLRPICSVHHCDILSFGALRTGTTEERAKWTDRYFDLREQCGADEDLDEAYRS